MTPQEIATIQLLELAGMGPARFRWLTATMPADEVIASFRAHKLPREIDADFPHGLRQSTIDSWFSLSSKSSAGPDRSAREAVVQRYESAQVELVGPEHELWPFANDPEPPAVLFCQGRIDLLAKRPAVGVVGTRRCTSVGRRVAAQMGADLAAAGVSIVSGLALGVDGSAHNGALAWAQEAGRSAAVVAVVACGLDIIYPPRNAQLWHGVSEHGLLVSETPLGVRPSRWRFPARNRLIAGMSDAVVVVESHGRGGALSTATEAGERGVPVLVVPGSVTSPAADGTNGLLVDGCEPVRNAADVVASLILSGAVVVADKAEQLSLVDEDQLCEDVGTSRGGTSTVGTSTIGMSTHAGPMIDPSNPLAQIVLGEVAAGAIHIDELARVCDLPVAELLSVVQLLSLDSLVVLEGNRVRMPC